MKELIYNMFVASDINEVTWITAKKWGLNISCSTFHKLCNELIKDADLRKSKISGIWYYQLLNRQFRQINTEDKYNKLIKTGMFFEFYPLLSGNWNNDKDLILDIDNWKIEVL